MKVHRLVCQSRTSGYTFTVSVHKTYEGAQKKEEKEKDYDAECGESSLYEYKILTSTLED